MVLRFFLLMVLFSPPLFARGVDSISNPRASGSWIVDEAGVFSEAERQRVNGLIDGLEKQTGVELAVVALKSIGDEVPKQFAVDLFKHWGIGKKGRDNGLLVLFVLDQRRVEIETGYGLEGVLPDIVCAWVLREKMVPFLSKNQFGLGLKAGVEALAGILSFSGPDFGFNPNPLRTAIDKWSEGLFIAAALVFLFLLGRIGWVLVRSRDPYARFNKLRHVALVYGGLGSLVFAFALLFAGKKPPSIGIGVAGPLLAVLLFEWWCRSLRYRARPCRKCGGTMARVENLAQEREYMTKQQILEEDLRSLDYDVWLCACGNGRLDSYPGKLFTKYGVCPKCRVRAEAKISSRILEAPTHQRTGLEKCIYECYACQTRREQTVVLARLSSSGSSSSGGSSSGSSSSFGGGRSGGGGAGSSF